MRLYKKSKIFVAILLISIFAAIIFLSIRGSQITKKLCHAEINARINDMINQSNVKVGNINVFYSDYFTINYTDDKRVSSIKANTGLINQITLIWNTEIQNKLDILRDCYITLTVGALTGSAFLSPYGAEINIKTQVVSNCSITYKSEFIEKGINQTLHRFIMYTEVVGEILVPSKMEKVIVTQEVVLSETIINGEVPNAYLMGKESLDYLDLIP